MWYKLFIFLKKLKWVKMDLENKIMTNIEKRVKTIMSEQLGVSIK